MSAKGRPAPTDGGWEVRRRLLQRAVALPRATQAHPLGKDVVKVSGKVFVFLGSEDDLEPGIGVKLPTSHGSALRLSGTRPGGHGLGRHHWITIPIRSQVSESQLFSWVIESYRAVAPATARRLLNAADAQ